MTIFGIVETCARSHTAEMTTVLVFGGPKTMRAQKPRAGWLLVEVSVSVN